MGDPYTKNKASLRDFKGDTSPGDTGDDPGDTTGDKPAVIVGTWDDLHGGEALLGVLNIMMTLHTVKWLKNTLNTARGKSDKSV